jgi:hypothetical protein
VRIAQDESFELWDPNIYAAKVIDVIEEPAEGSKYGKPRLRFVFLVHDPNRPSGEDTQKASYWTGTTLSTHEKATFRPLAAVLRPDLNLDDPELELDTGRPDGFPRETPDPFVGVRCRVILGLSPDGRWNRVEKVLAADVKPQAPRRPVAAGAKEAAPPF